MQTAIHGVTNAAEVIQLAVAPVFLLTGVGSLLAVLTGRLGRVVDRFRALHEKCESPQAQTDNPSCINYKEELHILSIRANWVQAAIMLSSLSLFLVALVIGMLFLGSAISWDSAWLVSLLFILAMISLIIGLGCFLREIYMSKHTFELSTGKNKGL